MKARFPTLSNTLRRPPSRADGPGYVYAYLIKGESPLRSPEFQFPFSADQQHSPFLRIKVGRTNNVQRRLHEWRRSCAHSVPVLLGHHSTRYAHKLERVAHVALQRRALWRNVSRSYQARCNDCEDPPPLGEY